MVPVVSSAEPAELIATLRASHVHASLVLLDLYFALWTVLSVKLDPEIRITFASLDLRVPLNKQVTVNRSMRALKALEAPIVSTLAINVRSVHRLVLIRLRALGRRTPLGIFVDVDERVCEIILVLSDLLRRQKLAVEPLWDDQLAPLLRTSSENAVRAVLERRL